MQLYSEGFFLRDRNQARMINLGLDFVERQMEARQFCFDLEVVSNPPPTHRPTHQCDLLLCQKLLMVFVVYFSSPFVAFLHSQLGDCQLFSQLA